MTVNTSDTRREGERERRRDGASSDAGFAGRERNRGETGITGNRNKRKSVREIRTKDNIMDNAVREKKEEENENETMMMSKKSSNTNAFLSTKKDKE